MYQVVIAWANGFEASYVVKGSSFGEAQQNAAKLVRTFVEVCESTPVDAVIWDGKGNHYNVMIKGSIL